MSERKVSVELSKNDIYNLMFNYAVNIKTEVDGIIQVKYLRNNYPVFLLCEKYSGLRGQAINNGIDVEQPDKIICHSLSKLHLTSFPINNDGILEYAFKRNLEAVA